MGKRRWTTPDQQVWLEARIPAFVKAQEDKTTSSIFFPDTHKAWQQAWPTEPPTPEELQNAKGNEKLALANKIKATEGRVLYWFHNHTRTTSSGTGKRGLLKIKPKAKLPKAWQTYQTLYYKEKLKPVVDAAYENYLKTVPEDTKPTRTRFAIMNEVVQNAWANETDEVKQKVEEHRQKVKEEPSDESLDNEARNTNYQNAIDRFPQTLASMGNSLAEQTGWNLTCIAGGPNPRMGGKITTFVIHFGKTSAGDEFDQSMSGAEWDAKVMEPFDKFLHKSFPQNVCDERALTISSMQSTTPEPELLNEPSDNDGDSEPGSPLLKKRKSGSTPAIPNLSEYEITREANRVRNAGLAKELDDKFRAKYAGLLPECPKPTQKRKGKKKKDGEKKRDGEVLRRSARNNQENPADSCNPVLSTPTECVEATSVAASHDGNGKVIDSPPESNATPPTLPNPGPTELAASTTPESPDAAMTNGEGPAVHSMPNTIVPRANPEPTQTPVICSGTNVSSMSNADVTMANPLATPPSTATTTDTPASLVSPASEPNDLAVSPTPKTPVKSNILQSDHSGDGSAMGNNESPSKKGSAVESNRSGTGCGVGAELCDASSLFWGDASTLSGWLKDSAIYFRTVFTSNDWQRLIARWLMFEQRCQTEGKLPTKYRPEEVAWWMQRHRRFELVPKVKPSEFGVEWRAWWSFMQPAWRDSDVWPMSHVVPDGAEWKGLERGGANGLFLVIIALSWWAVEIPSQCDQQHAEFMMAVHDVDWVLAQLLKKISIGKKRAATDFEEQPAAKRFHLTDVSD